ncbi:short subunit dehydrogenase [Paraburkholderia sp. BL23I1N1]|uniref:SDR family oxidoreductase n=1 Tax=Paraburkholderia sp. BL23I1N1 TaxID=1938802 RepID=UPI000FF29C8E|nr:SDR family oxidoreductase [Paraburkholderia sp. BL23I1N1]RKE23841.1 short subunit dehydrogenase [Paraburkholderia sp. BL23I1N1]
MDDLVGQQDFAGDLSAAASAEELARRYPDVEILVNNLGISEPKPFEEIPDAARHRFFDVNVLSGVRLARLFLRAMRQANWGRIIFISSESAVQIPAEVIHYGMTKPAPLVVSGGLTEAVAGTSITVNSVLPGPTKSRGVGEFVETLAKANGKSFEALKKGVLQEDPPHIAHQAIWFASANRAARGLYRQPAFAGHDGSCVAGRRGRYKKRHLDPRRHWPGFSTCFLDQCSDATRPAELLLSCAT